MTGDAGTPLTAKWQIIELAKPSGSIEIEDFHPIFHFGDESVQGPAMMTQHPAA